MQKMPAMVLAGGILEIKKQNIMSNIARGDNSKEIRSLIQNENVKKRFAEILGKSAPAYLASLLSLVNATHLKKCDPASVMNAAQMAAALNLPINPNLGFAWIIPYKQVAQFQVGYKGFKQLAVRSGLFQYIEAKEVFEGQYVANNSFIGYEFDWSKKASDKVIGYAAQFQLLNTYHKTIFSTVEQIDAHAKRYSKTYKKDDGIWFTNYREMALKTVIKKLLNGGDAPLSIEMQTANIVDQAQILNPDTLEVAYLDNAPDNPHDLARERERERYADWIAKNVSTLEDLEARRREAENLADNSMHLEVLEEHETKIKNMLKNERD